MEGVVAEEAEEAEVQVVAVQVAVATHAASQVILLATAL